MRFEIDYDRAEKLLYQLRGELNNYHAVKDDRHEFRMVNEILGRLEGLEYLIINAKHQENLEDDKEFIVTG